MKQTRVGGGAARGRQFAQAGGQGEIAFAFGGVEDGRRLAGFFFKHVENFHSGPGGVSWSAKMIA